MSEYDAFNGLSASKEEAKRELLKKATEEYLEREKILKLMNRRSSTRNLILISFLVIMPLLYQLLKKIF